jgi:acetylornithine deacetylase/succinyl-diaminopimelate desuccinylase-like protein
MHELLKTICEIPAPSHFEDKRAVFVKNWLDGIGAKGAYIDEAKNVVLPMNCEGRDDIIVFEAHTDIVFPEDVPLNFTSDGTNFYCPGVGDDTACLVIMMMIIKYIVQNKITPQCGVLFVANACEEGLGNLKGTRQIFQDYQGRITRFVTFDGTYKHVTCRAVGSHRYSISATTKGGHSWSNFGNTNAIWVLSKLVSDLYTIQIPEKENSRTTFNVGGIEGGTSVNTIAQNASMLFKYRSNDPECLAYMEKEFNEKIEAARQDPTCEIQVEIVGIRPCGEVKEEWKGVHEEMIRRAAEVSSRYYGAECIRSSGSTDCNIPLSLGVPAICPGLYLGGGAHTREEWLEIKSLENGLKIAAHLILDYFNI